MLRFTCLALLICALWLTAAQAAPLIPLDTPPKPTGDALWDAYAQAVWQQLLHPEQRELPRAALVPDSATAQWSELGSDPRLWQLKLWTDTTAATWIDELGGQDAGGQTWDLLAEARTWATVIDGRHEATITTRLYGMDVQEKIEVGQPTHWTPPALDDARSYWFQYYDKVAAEGKEFDQEKLDFPDSAWPYYLKALYYDQLGEYDLAQAQLTAGNARPEYTLPSFFPCDKAIAMLADDIQGKSRLDTGNLIVALAVRDALGVERLPAVLAEVSDFRTSSNYYTQPPEYSMGYPLYHLVDRAVASRDVSTLQSLAAFGERAISARPDDSRLAVLGLSAAEGLVAKSEEGWVNSGQTPPPTPLHTETWLTLLNLIVLSGSPGRQMLFDSCGVGDLAWLYDQRFVQGQTPDEKAWTQRANFWSFNEMPNPQTIAKDWDPDAGAPGVPQASVGDTVALLNAFARTLYQASADYGFSLVLPKLHDQDWAALLPPQAE